MEFIVVLGWKASILMFCVVHKYDLRLFTSPFVNFMTSIKTIYCWDDQAWQ